MQVLKRLFGFLKPYWKTLLISGLLLIGRAGFELVPPLFQRAIVDSGSLADEQVIRSLLDPAGSDQPQTAAAPGIGDNLTLTEFEKRHIEAVLRRCAGNRTRAAEILGIERKSLYRKAERLGIALDPEEVES